MSKPTRSDDETEAIRMNDTTSVVTPLIRLALRGLAPLYDDQQRLFVYKTEHEHRVPTPLTATLTYTAITLLGLIKAQKQGWGRIAIDEVETLNTLIENRDRLGRVGELGLLLWVDAHCGDRHQECLLDAISRRTDASTVAQLATMELAWLLIGLCYAHRSVRNARTEGMAMTFHDAMKSRFHPETGLFCHRVEGAWPASLRNHIGNFADQIYAVYALSTFYEEFQDPGALQAALQCADRLCHLQGEHGQWWWHYHAPRGTVASRYPVFAVHQDGMAPMALRKLSAVSGRDYQSAIHRGLSWLLKPDELAGSMVEWERDIVWRDIEVAPPLSYLRYVSMVLAGMGADRAVRRLNRVTRYKVNREMRSYELGWLLYAFADAPAS